VFVDGQKVATLRGADVADQFKVMVADYIERKFGAGAKEAAE
jgi:(E)-4-hydroxy-3-methylbut-2-enyl-diphosphate synthase